ncbi:MAG: bifunctional RNase H/acid phosphatase [Mycobacteriaceae bacterium]
MRVVLQADGGSRGNPGPAGYGAVVFSADQVEVLIECKESIGYATNNVAEYRGLIAGLTAARDIGATEVIVAMDSKLVVEQMSGRWKVKHPDLIPLFTQAMTLVRAFAKVEFGWIPRAQNFHADKLANEAMDQGCAQIRTLSTVPSQEHPDMASKVAKATPGWTGAQGKPARLLLLRHGQTALSVDRRYSGIGNPELTDIGKRQAEQAAMRIGLKGGIQAVISSPLSRAMSTAEVTAKALGLKVQVHEGLIETNFGQWEGLTFTQAAQRDPELHQNWLADTSIAPPGGESFDEVHQRVQSTCVELVNTYAESNIVVVSHVTPIKAILRLALDGGPALLYKLHLDLASLSIAEFYPDSGSSVRLVNDTSHLS